MNDSSSTPATSPAFGERMQGEAGMLFIFYWLFRWLMPDVLPESLRETSMTHLFFICMAGGAILAAIKCAGAAHPPK